ncbi:MAG: hypothetical protein KBE09_03845 [Candidatus Pacebacteria bacterium]|nr:hypothetical protein [Candidatus Paceibacterota bacterium]
MELTAQRPDISTWRHERHEAYDLDGVMVPGLFRDVYRYRDPGAAEDSFSCALYTLNGTQVLVVWGVVGGADCCRFHQVEEGDVIAGPPAMSYEPATRMLHINQTVFSI